MTVTPAADAAYFDPTLEGFRNRLLDLTTRNTLLNLSLKSQRTARLLRFVDCSLQDVLDGLTSRRQHIILSAFLERPKKKQTVDEGKIEAVLLRGRGDGLLDSISLDVGPDKGLDKTQL